MAKMNLTLKAEPRLCAVTARLLKAATENDEKFFEKTGFVEIDMEKDFTVSTELYMDKSLCIITVTASDELRALVEKAEAE